MKPRARRSHNETIDRHHLLERSESHQGLPRLDLPRNLVDPFEVIVSDNGSTDASVEYIREHFPDVRIVENGANLGFARGNNAGISVAQGEYVLILNPDTIIHDRALEKLVAYADTHPEGGAFGCRVLNPDGSFQNPARPLPTPFGALISALNLRWLGELSDGVRIGPLLRLGRDDTERPIGFQSGCCIMVRRELLERLARLRRALLLPFRRDRSLLPHLEVRLANPVLSGRRDHPSGRPIRRQISRSGSRSKPIAVAIAIFTSISADEASSRCDGSACSTCGSGTSATACSACSGPARRSTIA